MRPRVGAERRWAATERRSADPPLGSPASRRWADAVDILRDPAPIALRWLRAAALRALDALDKADRLSEHDPGLRELAKLAAVEAAMAWHLCTGLVRAGAPAGHQRYPGQNRDYDIIGAQSEYGIQPINEAGLAALAEAQDAEALVHAEGLWPDSADSRYRNAFGTTAQRWVHQCVRLDDHDFAYSDMNVLHLAAANAAPLHLVNAVIRVAGASESPPARARCSVRRTIETGGQSADVPLGSEMQPAHVAIKADGAAELVQLLLQAKGGEF